MTTTQFIGVPFGRKNPNIGSRFVKLHTVPPEREYPRQWLGKSERRLVIKARRNAKVPALTD